MRLWLDDVRPMPVGYDLHAITANEAIILLKTGLVKHVSLDHDLGTEDTGYTVAQWIEEEAFNGRLNKLTWNVHSANPVGAAKMTAALQNADKFWSK